MNVFYKESESKKNSICFFFGLFFLVKGVGGGGVEGRVSECLTMDPNKKNVFGGGGGGGKWREGGG